MEARFKVAARHSRRVRFLRVAVPAVVTVAMLVIVGASLFNPFRILTKLPLEVGNLVVSGTKVTMESPRLAGFMPDQRPYELRAQTATQDIKNPKFVELNVLDSTLEMEDKSTVRLRSRTGLFDSKAQLLDLRDDVFVQNSLGYEARMSQAFVDLGKGTVSSDTPVAVKLPNGTIDGQQLRITERGAVLRFDGGVVMHLDGQNGPASGTSASASAPVSSK
ncbi:MAG: LPS export ABC transporter periplasmic protein LptC [Proteobacteria bacterium SG_bin9]|nr:MAG: LPS export ABC transporter periplasmic protein LptC [Proteobacteria bacterium SG_bin9]